jgi:hypothetical protein
VIDGPAAGFSVDRRGCCLVWHLNETRPLLMRLQETYHDLDGLAGLVCRRNTNETLILDKTHQLNKLEAMQTCSAHSKP